MNLGSPNARCNCYQSFSSSSCSSITSDRWGSGHSAQLRFSQRRSSVTCRPLSTQKYSTSFRKLVRGSKFHIHSEMYRELMRAPRLEISAEIRWKLLPSLSPRNIESYLREPDARHLVRETPRNDERPAFHQTRLRLARS